MRIERKTPEQIGVMRRAGLVVRGALDAAAAAAQPGATTAHVNAAAESVIEEAGATSSFLGYDGGMGSPPFPAVTCVSVNEQVVHGIPGEREIRSGDLVSVDCGAIVDGWHGDAAVTISCGDVNAAHAELSAATRRALWAGIAQVRPGARLGDVEAAIGDSVRSESVRYGIVPDFTGHGIGSAMHMAPDVHNTGRRGTGPRLREGMAIAIEPMLTLGTGDWAELDDEWTIATRDGLWAAHWEHTVAVTAEGAWVLTASDGGAEELPRHGGRFAPLGD